MRVRAVALLVVLVAVLAAAVPVRARAGAGAPTTWYLVVFDARIEQAHRDRLQAAGGRGLQYHPANGYLAWLDAAGADAALRQPDVSHVSAVAASDKVDPSVDAGASGERLLALIYAPARADALTRLAREARIVADRPGVGGPLHEVFLTGAKAMSVADDPSVLYVGPAPSGPAPLDELSDQLQAGNGTNVGYEGWLAARGLDGRGVRVSVVDTGVDGQHPDLRGRVVAKADYTAAGAVPVAYDDFGHGTHVAGIVGGDGAGLAGPAARQKDGSGFLYGLGVAPKVEIVDQNAIAVSAAGALCREGSWPPPYPWDRLTRDSLARGSHVWNASWQSCEGSGVGYIASARTMDVLVRDGDPASPGAEPFTMVFAAGNSGGNASTVTAPSEAKNLIAVAASNNARDGYSPNGIADFSSRGPAKDGRVVPVVAAPGRSIISARASSGTVACGVPLTTSFGLYASCSGTSMAAPHVTGAVALLTQAWRRTHAADPSPAVVKGLLVNTATDLGVADIPNRTEGWGRVNLASALDALAGGIVRDQERTFTDPGDDHVLRIAPADPALPLRVTLVWSDAPGAAGASRALVNDLDLTVAAPDGRTFVGNRFSKGKSVAGGSGDRINNVENIVLPAPAAGEYVVKVSAFDLPGDGVPFAGDETDQDFALVLSNAVLVG